MTNILYDTDSDDMNCWINNNFQQQTKFTEQNLLRG